MTMSKWVKRSVKVICWLAGVIVLLMVGCFAMLNTSWLQNKLLEETTALLTEKLETKVKIDSVSIDLLTLDAKLYRLDIEDRQQRKMLLLDYLQADVDLWPLLNDEFRISQVKVKGVKAHLIKLPKDSLSPDTVANFQFLIDTFKSDKKKSKEKLPTDSIKKKKKLDLTIDDARVEDIHVVFNNDTASLGKLSVSISRKGTLKGQVENLRGCWSRFNKKGVLVTNEALVTSLKYTEEDSLRLIELSRVNFKTDNHRPRKNTGKPKRGFFDVGHFNIWADMKICVDKIEQGNVHGWLREFTAQDSVTGMDITKLQCEVLANKEGLVLSDVVVCQKNTELRFALGKLKFPNKKAGTKLSYVTSTITGHTYLKDISRSFAPVLRNFSLPLDLKTRMEGDDEGMRFRDVRVTRPGGLLSIKADGYITGLKNKYDLKVHFDVHEAIIKGGEKERLINQFVVKKFMMKQLHALGTIHYTGSFNVLWKKEEFQGKIRTQVGDIQFYFALDENNKYVFGNAKANDIKLGTVLDMSSIGPVSVTADFKFDISKPRTAVMRRKLGGKLPIGEVKAHVFEASYSFVKVRNVDVNIVSNGAVAEGDLQAPGSFADLSCTFSFTNTNELQKMKIKPKMRINLFRSKSSDDEKAAKKAAKDEEKQRKADEKAAKKAAKEEKKALEKQRKAEEKAAKKAAKEEKKAEKKKRKEEEKQRKAAEKAAKDAA